LKLPDHERPTAPVDTGLSERRPEATEAAWASRFVRVLSSVLFALVALGNADLMAQSDPSSGGPGRWQLGAFGGWYSGGTPYVLRTPSSNLDVQLGSAAAYGLALEFDPLPWLGLSFEWCQSHSDVTVQSVPPAVTGTLPVNTYLFVTSFYLGTERLKGFATLGFGGEYISPYVPGAFSGDTDFTASLGLGGKAFLDRHVGLRLDARVLESYANVSPQVPLYCGPAGCYHYKRNWFLTYRVTGGVFYAF